MSARERAAEAALAAVRRAARRLGRELVPAGVYSPKPDVPAPDDPAWSREHPFPVDTEAHLAFLESVLAPHLRELPQGLELARRHGWQTWNGWYEAGDAEVLWAMVRHLRPRRMVELGSGFSTLVTASACAANAREGAPTELVAIDPEPRTEVAAALEGRRARRAP